MGCQLAGWIYCSGARVGARLADRRGQGTVEYIGMVVMVTILVAAVAVAAKGWAPDVGGALKKGLVSAITKLITGFIT